MSATSKLITVTQVTTNNVAELASNKIIYVSASGSGSHITYTNLGADIKSLIVTETPSAISSASATLIPVTDAILGTVTYINPDRIIDVTASGSYSLTAGIEAGSADTTATPVIVTITAHGFSTGQAIVIAGATGTGATAINGAWIITKTGANTFTLDGSVGIALSTVVLTSATLTYVGGHVYYNHDGAAPNIFQTRESKTAIQTAVNAIAV